MKVHKIFVEEHERCLLAMFKSNHGFKAVDFTIAYTINRHGKSWGTIVEFSCNGTAYYIWCITRHTRATYKLHSRWQTCTDEESLPKDNRPSRIAQTGKDVRKVQDTVQEFINPVQLDCKCTRYCLSSGDKAPELIAKNPFGQIPLNKKHSRTGRQKILVHKSITFHEPIRRNKLQTFAPL